MKHTNTRRKVVSTYSSQEELSNKESNHDEISETT